MVVGFCLLSAIWGGVVAAVLWACGLNWSSLFGFFAGPFVTIGFLEVMHLFLAKMKGDSKGSQPSKGVGHEN